RYRCAPESRDLQFLANQVETAMRTLATAILMATAAAACADAAAAQGGYGSAVAASRNVLYVAEPLNVARPGTVYAYERGSDGMWREVGRVRAPASRAGDLFARSIAAAGDVVIVGYPAEAAGAGAAHAFQRQGSTWLHSGRLVNPAGASGDSAGAA